jgi:TubC N-terminal docking domain
MTALQLLAQLRVLGVHLEPAGDRLRYRPASAISSQLLDALREHKAELLGLLEIQRVFGADVVDVLTRKEGERHWQAPLAKYAAARPMAYQHPWPNAIDGLGPHHVGPFGPCASCGQGSWSSYGAMRLCHPCARQRVRR